MRNNFLKHPHANPKSISEIYPAENQCNTIDFYRFSELSKRSFLRTKSAERSCNLTGIFFEVRSNFLLPLPSYICKTGR